MIWILLTLVLCTATAGLVLVFFPEIKAWILKSNHKIGRWLGKFFSRGS